MNPAKYNSTYLYDRNTALLKQTHPTFISCRKISNDLYAVQMRADTYRITTSLQCAVFTLDNSKYWMKNFTYNFIYKCIDLNRIHVIEGDTDSKFMQLQEIQQKEQTKVLTSLLKIRNFMKRISTSGYRRRKNCWVSL
jgi:hypothetical protein